jgi:hypothetical protein
MWPYRFATVRSNADANNQHDTKMTTSYAHSIISDSATVLNADGFVIATGVSVAHCGDVIAIGAAAHRRDELTILADRIESIHGWTVLL